MKYDTLILHNGNELDETTGALSIPIYQTSTFSQEDVDHPGRFMYSRSENPTRLKLENTIAALESGSNGYAFSSGMAAICSSIMAFASQNDHIIATRDIYGGSYRALNSLFPRFGIKTDFVDMTDPDIIEKSIRPETKVLFIETPSNPLLKVIDLKACVKIAKKNNLITLIDNTFMSPYFLKPIELGIDVVIHSATKFLGGHSDLLGGLVVTANSDLGRKIYSIQNSFGAVLSPQDSFLLMRGIKTLRARMVLQQDSANYIAQKLRSSSLIDQVFYPGFHDHPGHNIMKEQCSGYGCVVSFKTKTPDQAKKIMKNVKLWTVAVSLGGVESILSYPFKMSHYAIPEAERKSLGIDESVIRLSVGLEDRDDLLNDILTAIN